MSDGVDEDGMPTMECPRCGVEMVDYDGFGVMAHLGAGGCGYCRHASRSDGVCGYCGDDNGDGK